MLWELSVVEQRYVAVQEVLGGMPVTEVADRYGVSRQSVHGWLRRYRAEGLAGLQDRSHRPRSCPHQASVQVEAQVCELRRQHPSWGPLRLQHELGRRGVVGVPSRAGIYRILVRHHLIEPGRRRRRRRDWRRWERQRPMQLWQLDIVGGIRLTDGTECKLVSGIDDHSRFCVIASLVPRATGRAVCAAFVAALARYGVPAEVLTDNGRQFTGRFGKPRPAEVMFDRICRENAITHRLTGVRSPTTTGKVERFHKTLRSELLATLPAFPSLEVAQKVIDDWVADYNCRRPHQAIGMATPAARFHADPSTGDALALQLPTRLGSSMSALPLGPLELEVVVPACGNLGLAGRQLWLGRRHAGRKVSLWIDHQVIHLSQDGQLLKTVASRFTAAELPRLVHLGARPAGPPPTATPADPQPISKAVEVDRLVNAAGLIGLGGRQFSVGQQHAGQQVTVRLDGQLAHVLLDGVLVKTIPSPVPASTLHRLQGARAAISPLQAPHGPLLVQRRVSSQGGIQIAGQKLQVGKGHAGTTVTVLVADRHFQILDGQTPITTIPRHSTREVTRYKAYDSKPTRDQGCQASTEP
ncbi:MAG TPA: IS481 family transposase [Actinomycetes bacterium]|nr:IS481 family transposase [Actinomycetes bacterium]